jgi:hypothetical protein
MIDTPREGIEFQSLLGSVGSAGSRAVALGYLQTQLPDEFHVQQVGWWRRWSLPVASVLALAAIVLALVGGVGTIGGRLLETLKLFPSGFPGRRAAGDSVELFAAKIMAAIVSGTGLIAAVVAVYSRQLNAHRARMRRNHVVVCGLGEKGLRSARAFRDRGFKVTCVDPDSESEAAYDIRARGAVVLRGDATRPQTLLSAAVDRAAYVVCACAEDEHNAQIAAQLTRLCVHGRRRRKPVTVFAHIADPELASLLAPPAHGVNRLRIEFFNIYELWAEAIIDFLLLQQGPADAPHLIVLGCTPLGRAVVAKASRRWHFLAEDGSSQLRITLIGANAEAHRQALLNRFPRLEERSLLVPVDHPLAATYTVDFSALADQSKPTAVVLCLADDSENLTLALKARAQLSDECLVVVPATPWTGQLAALALTAESGIYPVGYSTVPDSLDLLVASRRETLARAVHMHYLGTAGQARTEADAPWEALDEDLREANRSQVDGLVQAVSAVWYELVPAFDWDQQPVELRPREIETLARFEHERWCNERQEAGWSHGPQHDRELRLHPDLVSWQELADGSRQKDRDAVAGWPALLAIAGYRLERRTDRERLAEFIHERHRLDRTAQGEHDDANPLLRPWAALGEHERELSRASADEIATKLAHVGCHLVFSWKPGPAWSPNAEELERLARLEHERWCELRRNGGWRHGAQRNDDEKRHPDLVPWQQLPDSRREIDREHVRAIPDLLAAVGLKAVRTEDAMLARPRSYRRTRPLANPLLRRGSG